MEGNELTISALALILGLGWASGISLYALISLLGLAGATGVLALPPQLQVLQNPGVIGVAGFLYLIEFFLDKTPGFDSLWDAIHTFVRIPAGAILAMLVVDEAPAAMELLAAVLGATMATAAHLIKTLSRLLINTSPEPLTNWVASVGEDIALIAVLWLLFAYPGVFLVFAAIFVALAVWLLPKLYRVVRSIFARLQRWLDGTGQARCQLTRDGSAVYRD